MTRIGTQPTQPRADFAGSVDCGWRVEPLPSRVGLCARVPERGGAAVVERRSGTQRRADTRTDADMRTGPDTKGLGRR